MSSLPDEFIVSKIDACLLKKKEKKTEILCSSGSFLASSARKVSAGSELKMID